MNALDFFQALFNYHIGSMSNNVHQKQQEQVSLLESQRSIRQIDSGVKLISFRVEQLVNSKTKNEWNDTTFHQTSTEPITESLQNHQNYYHTQCINETGCDAQILSKQKSLSTITLTKEAAEQKASSDYLKKFHEMREQAEEYMKEWLRLDQIQHEKKLKKIQEKAHQQRLQREQLRRKRIAMNTYSKQFSFFQNVKRFICIILNNNKENK